ncbi:MAG: 4-alpha-glucanotransferase [Kofleriaceae bacterium]
MAMDLAWIESALAELGVRRMLLAIHGPSFPSDPDEDVGRGAPGTRAAGRLFALARQLGFTGIQLGPEGQTSRTNASPYDGTIFSRDIGAITLGTFAELVPAAMLEGAVEHRDLVRTDHRRAYDVTHALVAAAAATLPARPALAARVAAFRAHHAGWLERDALYEALSASRHDAGYRHWSRDADLWIDDTPARVARRAELAHEHAVAIERFTVGQLLAHEQHARVRALTERLGLALYGDLQVGFSDRDAWSRAAAFLPGYAMGAPPSRTNPEGQPWGYPVLHPDQLQPGGGAFELVRARLHKGLSEYDSLRLDHPHGLVCPWVYKTDGDPARSVRAGARLFESPDLLDHPRLARFAIARAGQLDRTQPRHGDDWVIALEPDQVARYATLMDVVVAAARQHGRDPSDLSCEVLSTMPRPLRAVVKGLALGRWRVSQKANLDDVNDVYRSENANPADWVMLGNHDTRPIFAVVADLSRDAHDRWARHLAARLALAPADTARLAEPGFLATAMLAELFVCRAENVSIFFADLFGYTERFNTPGLVDDVANWSLRLPHTFAELYASRLARGQALDLPLALRLALAARKAGAR